MAQFTDYQKMEAFVDKLMEERRGRVSYWFATNDTAQKKDILTVGNEILELTTLLDAARATLKDEQQVEVGGIMG